MTYTVRSVNELNDTDLGTLIGENILPAARNRPLWEVIESDSSLRYRVRTALLVIKSSAKATRANEEGESRIQRLRHYISGVDVRILEIDNRDKSDLIGSLNQNLSEFQDLAEDLFAALEDATNGVGTDSSLDILSEVRNWAVFTGGDSLQTLQEWVTERQAEREYADEYEEDYPDDAEPYTAE